MPDQLNPGPPLMADKERYLCQPPGVMDYVKALGVAFLVILGGGVVWMTVTVATGRPWGLMMILIGLSSGWSVNRAAGQLRSIAMGVIAAMAAVLACTVGYMMLWLPFLDTSGIDQAFTWEDLALLMLMIFVSYRMAAPKTNARAVL